MLMIRFIILTFLFSIFLSGCSGSRNVDCPGVKGGSSSNMMLKTDKNGQLVARKVKKNKNGTVQKK